MGGAIVAGTIWAAGGMEMFMGMITGTQEVVRNLGQGAARAGYGAFGKEASEYAQNLAGEGAAVVAAAAAGAAAVSGATAVGEGVLDFFSNLVIIINIFRCFDSHLNYIIICFNNR